MLPGGTQRGTHRVGGGGRPSLNDRTGLPVRYLAMGRVLRPPPRRIATAFARRPIPPEAAGNRRRVRNRGARLEPLSRPSAAGWEGGGAAGAASAPVGGVLESGTPRDPARTVTTMSGGTVRPSWSASSYKRSLTWAAACVLAVAAPTPTRALAAPVTGGTVVGWGANGAGAAQPPAELDDVAAVAAGKVHSLALRADGTVQA